jgi:imidazolonepropionase-like amidohydrolase
MRLPLRTALVLLLLAPSSLFAQSETGVFRLHKFARPIGEERFTIERDGDRISLDADFSFTDRGSTVPLKATFNGSGDYTPRSFAIRGSTSRFSTVDVEVTIAGGQARVRDAQQTTTVPLPQAFFTLAGYAPASVEMLLVRYWRAHGSPAQLTTLPSGTVRIADRGMETFTVGERRIELQRYSIKGLVWGIETLWMDRDGSLAALVTRDAEFDHFEAIRTDLQPALPAFIASAANDAMAEFESISRSMQGRRPGSLALTGVTMIDGTGNAPVRNATIVTAGGRIVAAGPAATVAIPADATRIDASGRFVIPGLWDMHAHFEQVEWGPIYLAAGITTVRDVGNELDFVRTVRDGLEDGRGLGPRLLLAGIVDGESAAALGVTRVTSPAEAATWVKTYHDAGFQQIKIYSSVTKENVKAICDAAHALGMTVTGHVPVGMDIYEAVGAGMDQINHISYLIAALQPPSYDPSRVTLSERIKALAAIDVRSPAGRKLVAFLKQHGTVIDDTTALFELTLRPDDRPVDSIEPGASRVAPELRGAIFTATIVPKMNARDARRSVERTIGLLRALHAAGVPIVAGTDQSVPGHSLHRQLELYVQAGFTPMEALQAATVVPARVMKMDGESGTIEAGKRADLAILDANPLDDIRNIRTVRSVVTSGVLYDAAPLWTSAGFTP